MTEQYPKKPSSYTPPSTQPAPHYASDAIPTNANFTEYQFDETAAWDSPLDRVPVEQPVKQAAQIGQNPFAQKRTPVDPNRTAKQKKRTAKLALYITVITTCLAAIAVLCILMMPQVAGYFWTDLDNYAFINGELLRYDSSIVHNYKQYKGYLQQDVIYAGIFIDGIYVGNKTLSEAAEALGDENTASSAFSITISIGDKVWTLDNTNVAAHRDINGALLKAYAYGRQNTTNILTTQRTPFHERVGVVTGLYDSPVYLNSKQVYDYTTVQAVIDDIARYVTRAPVDSQIVSFDFNSRTFTFSDDQIGITLDSEALYNQVVGLLRQGVVKQTVSVTPTITLPTVTKEDLQATFSLVAAFTTKTSSSSNRNSNINLACQAINGTVLLPGETFSFNGTVGQRTVSAGYKEAGAISGGELIQEVGGGICQVSSTLFNAAARADLEIISRSPHAWPSTYVEKGEDATVNWPDLDFKFKNNKDTPVFVIMYYKDRKCTAEIWGVSLGDNVSIDLESTVTKTLYPSTEIVYVQNTSLPYGASKETVAMRTGYVVDTYKVWYQNGVEFKREKMYTSTYRAYQKTIEYN